MLNKIALRNARRLWKDYLNYFLTLCVITALMFSFHSLLFSKDIYEMIYYGNSGELSAAGMMLITFMTVSTVVILICNLRRPAVAVAFHSGRPALVNGRLFL